MIVVNDGVYLYEVQQLENGGEAKGIAGNFAKIVLNGNTEGAINEAISISVAYQDYQGNPLSQRSTAIRITGPGQTVEQTLTVDQTSFDFVSEVPGRFIIHAQGDIPCDEGILEVVVQ